MSGPLWREEFSVRASEESYVSRRQFGKFLILTSLGMFVGNLWILLRSWLRRPPAFTPATVARLSELAEGGVKLFRYPTANDPCILVRRAGDEVVAYSQKCTHLSCAVTYSAERGRLECPCHQGYFSVRDGRVLQGPPQRPLPKVRLERRGDELVAIGMDEGEGDA